MIIIIDLQNNIIIFVNTTFRKAEVTLYFTKMNYFEPFTMLAIKIVITRQ